jgi:UDP-GlcNAc:undecaprenyl-phosphate GlcNAc-1-phosphate transferase
MALATLVVLGTIYPSEPGLPFIFAGAIGAFALGLLDDFRHIAPSSKVVGKVIVASILAFGGVRAELLPWPPLTFVLTVFWLVAVMNALNLMDNMDGLAAGVAAIAGIILAIGAGTEVQGAAFIGAATAGAALGFLVHNFYPARVFMGDAGSLLLGYLLATSALLHTANSVANVGLAVLAPLAALVLPFFDTALVTAARSVSGTPVSQGGRDHTSHRLAALGLSDRATVVVLYAIALSFGVLGLIAQRVASVVAPLLALAVVGLVLFGVFLLEADLYGVRGSAKPSLASSGRAVRADLLVYGRFGAEVAIDLALLTTVYYLAHQLRFEGFPENEFLGLFAKSVPLVVGAQLALLVVSRTYRTLWRYLSITDVVAIVRAISLGTIVGVVAVLVVYRFEGFSRAVFVFDWIFACSSVIGARAFFLWLIHWFGNRPRVGQRRVIVVGAGDSGAVAMRLLSSSRQEAYVTVGFLDDDPGKRYRRVSGIPVVGTTAELETAAARLRADLVIVALDQSAAEHRAKLRALCERLGIECREFLAAV